jgi:hypothetical protein
MPDQMICPKANGCPEFAGKEKDKCKYGFPHERGEHNVCHVTGSLCPACIPAPAEEVKQDVKISDTMNIYAKNGAKVIYSNPTGGYPADCEDAKKHLKLISIYTVDHTHVGGFDTRVYLKEVEGKCFNSCLFVDYAEKKAEEVKTSPEPELWICPKAKECPEFAGTLTEYKCKYGFPHEQGGMMKIKNGTKKYIIYDRRGEDGLVMEVCDTLEEARKNRTNCVKDGRIFVYTIYHGIAKFGKELK